MRRKLTIPYSETTIMVLVNLTSDTKFLFIAKVKDINESKITVTDNLEELELSIEGEILSNLDVGETIIVFGEKKDSIIRKEHIMKLNIDWNLYFKTQEIESR
ncbi:MAG: hypothetical protein ACFFAJ_03380 [Candidatus Hodarchaeota archaeon]